MLFFLADLDLIALYSANLVTLQYQAILTGAD